MHLAGAGASNQLDELAGAAGLLIAPLFSVHSDMGTLFGIKAFAVAILGGMTSASGVMIAGFIYGLVEAISSHSHSSSRCSP